MKAKARLLTPSEWGPVVAAPAIAFWLTQHFQPWLVMWSLAISIFFGFKWLTWKSTLRRLPASQKVSSQRSIAYWLAWPGMNAKEFLVDTHLGGAHKPASSEWYWSFINFIFGLCFFWIVTPQIPIHLPLLRGWTGLAGLVFIMHFGLFRILSCFWRWQGVQAPPLMNNPLASSKLSEFWGNRWNTAFRDLTRDFLFKPMARHLSPKASILLGFLASGLIHDIVISVPAKAEYGLPTLYFLIQGLGIQVERSQFGERIGLNGSLNGRVFTAMITILPAGLLFHRSFIEAVILPFIDTLT